MKRLLGVLDHGAWDGFPFASCFDGIENIKTVEEFDPEKFSALVFWGGSDISPTLYNEKPNAFCQATAVPSRRDLLEWTLMRTCKANGIPMIGVCRGAQLLCAFAGGTLAQDVDGHLDDHQIITNTGEHYTPRANHHQMMLCDKVEHELIAWADPPRSQCYRDQFNCMTYFKEDFKEPEIVWFPTIKGLAIQPHPEWMSNGPFTSYIQSLTNQYCVVGELV